MGASYWLLVLVGGASLLSIICGDVVCRTDGQPGVNGEPGRDGLPGTKGQKGEPAVSWDSSVDSSNLLRLKGNIGPQGPQGPMGPKGFRGNLGLTGPVGVPGSPGLSGHVAGHNSAQKHSAFSVIRTSTGYPPTGQVVTFDRVVVNEPSDFNINTGHFTCSSPGVYYFTFHCFSRVSMCLSISSDTGDKLGFCDYNNNYEQVLSGGVVLELKRAQRVWLESFHDKQTNSDLNDRRQKEIIFNGFLLF